MTHGNNTERGERLLWILSDKSGKIQWKHHNGATMNYQRRKGMKTQIEEESGLEGTERNTGGIPKSCRNKQE